MTCAWDAFLALLPPQLRQEVDRQGRENLQELRMRLGNPAELVLPQTVRWSSAAVTREDIQYCVNSASRYSPWAASSASMGYITARGGHRVGLCGETVLRNGGELGFQEIDSLCIRVARDFPGIGRQVSAVGRNLLILGAPGWGKTTLLRDVARELAQAHTVAVVDERKELFPTGFRRGKRMDVLSGCGKGRGVDMALRSMGPEYIAVDEITAPEDCRAILEAAGCGVHLLATAHAASVSDFYRRPVYKPLLENRVFDGVVILKKDKSYREEGLRSC